MTCLPASRASRLAVLLCLVLAGELALPGIQHFGLAGISAAYADDDDDGGDDDDGDDDDRGGGYYRDDDDDRRRDSRTLWRAPRRESRPAPVRRRIIVPDRAPNEIAALGLDETSIATLVQTGFVVDDRQQIALTGSELVRLTIPQGMTLDAARQAVAAQAPSASVDFNHYYQPEQAGSAACGKSGCALVRHMVGWPVEPGKDGACITPQPIGLVDTAINAGHAAFDGARIEVIRLGKESLPRSGEQHGTAVAALLVGSPEGRTPGLLPSSELIAIDAFHRFGNTADIASAYDLVRALDLLAGRGVSVINLSLTGPPNLLLEQAVRTAVGQGAILIAAAGNDGPNAKPVYPAAYEDVIAVTAVDRARKPYRRAVRGPHIDIAAPGVGVWTAASISGARQKSGTSFAAPFVTAAAAVMRATRPELTPREIETELMRTAADMGTPGKDVIYGWGLLSAATLCAR
ncbi:S8 family serine peptidase [Rhizobium sp. LCM 4573]|uniref:S8 family serine peptidase n=1 Tax=Rhizobium sp. LCM 4573 TaxID=1848291 RepID=UPI0009F4F903|nr:S8 family serine peptidase [Rhizobium sp. LCM 4573]